MELPHIGEHCAESTCNKLDFLPFKCDLCKKQFCSDHHKYDAHSCPESYKLDVQIPICPLCEKPVANKPGQTPDLAVNDHLENNCKSKSKKIYNNKCSVHNCRQKEMISVKCNTCSLNYCLKHRNPIDHECKNKNAVTTKRDLTLNGSIFKNWFSAEASKSSTSMKPKESSSRNLVQSHNKNNIRSDTSVATAAAIAPPMNANISSLQGNMTEQEALNQAILASTHGSNSLPEVSISEDESLAQAIAASLEEQESKRKPKQTNDCSLC